MSTSRRSSLIALLGFVTAGCGGGGGSGTAQSMSGTLQTRAISSQANNTTYPLSIYLPAGSEAIRATLPTVYLLDGESRFQAVVDIVEARQLKVLVVGIGNEALRAHDYVPANLCTPGGGGQAQFLEFLRVELIPFIEANVGGDPQRRVLLGHSHGGSFVLYALFNEGPAGRRFSAYLASDASIDCRARRSTAGKLPMPTSTSRCRYACTSRTPQTRRTWRSHSRSRAGATPGWRWSRSSTAVVTSA